MSWFRLNRGVLAWLAFFALACQLFLSFGHVHIGTFNGGSAAWVAADGGGSSADISPPSQKNPAGIWGDFCAICANISLANALVLPLLAIILAPGLFTGVLRRLVAAREPASLDHLPFNARGPPHA